MKNVRFYIFNVMLVIITNYLSAEIIEKSGIISINEIWSDTIKVTNDITILQDGELIINPGTYIEFQDQYNITIKENGRIIAGGSSSDSIIFNSLDKGNSWNGIRFDSMWVSADSSIFNFTKILNCYTDEYQTGGSLTINAFDKIRISNSKLIFNRTNTRNGGAIYADSSNILISNCKISNNYSGNGGGFYFINSNPKIVKSEFVNNQGYWNGAAMYFLNSDPTIEGCKLSENYINSTRGEVIYIEDSEGVIINTDIRNNENKAIRCYHADISIINTLIANNGNEIGGIEILACNPKIINSTIVNNYGYNVGGISCWASKPLIINSIIWNNIGNENDIYYEGYQPKIINSDIKNGKNLEIVDSLYINNIDAYPKFVNPNQSIGHDISASQYDYSLMPCSPCINMGDSNLYPDTINNDLNNQARIYNDTIDMGSYELQELKIPLLGRKTIYVTEGGSGTGESWIDAMGNLQEAIEYPIGCYEGIDIWLAAGTYIPDTVGLADKRTASFYLRNNIAIYGGFIGNETLIDQRDYKANISTLSGDFGKTDEYTDNSYSVVKAIYLDTTSVLDGITISDGNSYAGNIDYEDGSGINMEYADLVIKNTTIQNNYARGSGGGLYLEYSNPYILNSYLYNNKAVSYGGGVYMSESDPNIVSSKIINNEVSGSFNGGGFYLSESEPKIINSVIANNESGLYGDGGGIYCSSSSPLILNSIIANNKSNDEGAGVYCIYDSYPYIVNSILWKNYDNNGLNHFSFFSDVNITIKNSNVQGGNNYGISADNYVENIDEISRFINPSLSFGLSDDALESDWNIFSCSPCINKGTLIGILNDVPNEDIIGNNRIFGDTIDIGPYEYNGETSKIMDKLIIYVKPNGTGNGYSWDDALGNLQDAINIPLGCYLKKEIWVVKGLYLPDTLGLEDQKKGTFKLRNNTEFYGGFEGNELVRTQRNWKENKTILSGNIGDESMNEDNSYHVITCENLDSTSVLDGFIVEDGYAYTDIFEGDGGGLICKYSNITLRNLTVRNNKANNSGGGIYCFGSDMKISNTNIFNNSTEENGGGICIEESNLLFINNKFINNVGEWSGGIHQYKSSTKIVNCVIANNAGDNAGGIFSNKSKSTILNSTITNNKASFGNAGGIKCWDSIFIQNTIISGNENNVGKNQIITEGDYNLMIRNSNIEGGNQFNLPDSCYENNIDSVSLFKSPSKIAGISENAIEADWNLSKCSPCIDKGLNELILDITDLDIMNNSRVVNGVVDIGAYEVQGSRGYKPSDFYLSNSTIKENIPPPAFIGEFISVDENPLDSFYYSFSDDENYYNYDTIYFKINNDSLLSDFIFDFEDRTQYSMLVKVRDQFGCSLDKEILIEILDSSATSTIVLNFDTVNEHYILYPNPAKSIVTLQNDYINNSDIEINLYSSEGKLLRSKLYVMEKSINFDVSSLKKGIYYIIISHQDTSKRITKYLIKY